MSNDKREQLRMKLQEHAGELIEAVIEGLAAIGSSGDWDSESIEHMVTPIQNRLEEWSIPIVGEPGLEDENTKYWAEIGGYDYEGEYPDEDEGPQLYEIKSKFVDMIAATVTRAQYGDGTLAVVAESTDEEGMFERYTLSTNLSAYGVPHIPNHFYVKDYAEGEGLADALVKAGIATRAVDDNGENRGALFGPNKTTASLMRLSEEIV